MAVLAGACCKKDDKIAAMETIDLANNYQTLSRIDSLMTLGDTVRWVCYGNSITYGGSVTYPQLLQDKLRLHYSNSNIVVHNSGQPGWTAPMALGGLDTLVLTHQPDIVSIIFGINDLYQGVSVFEYGTALHNMVLQLQQQDITVLVMSPTPLNVAENNSLVNYCIEAKEVAAADSVAFFHMHGAMVANLQKPGIDAEVIMPDAIHFTNEGYAFIGDTLFNWWTAMP